MPCDCEHKFQYTRRTHRRVTRRRLSMFLVYGHGLPGSRKLCPIERQSASFVARLEQQKSSKIHISVFSRLKQMPITLPSPRRAQLFAFWLIQSACAAFLAMIVCAALGVRRYLLLGIILGFLMALCGFWRPRAIASLYRVWNRCAERYAVVAKRLLLKICYYVVFTVVGCAGSSLRRSAKSQSLWVPRTTLPTNAYASQYDVALPGISHWSINYLGWAYKSGNIWAWGLLPFLMLIAALDTQESKTYPVSIYTLF